MYLICNIRFLRRNVPGRAFKCKINEDDRLTGISFK